MPVIEQGNIMYSAAELKHFMNKTFRQSLIFGFFLGVFMCYLFFTMLHALSQVMN